MNDNENGKNILNGETSTLDRQRISKNENIMHLIGTIDELNSHLGLVKAQLSCKETKLFIEIIQKNLMKLMSHVSNINNESYFFTEACTEVLDKEIERLSAGLELNQFVLPGRSTTEAQIHISRTVARRAERLFFACEEPLCQHAGAYLNKLSDYLFVLSHQETV